MGMRVRLKLMFNQPITFDSSELGALLTVLQSYHDLGRKAWADIIDREATQWRFGLFDEFKKISPTPSKILATAKKLGFAMNRHGNSITPAIGGVSRVANAAADSMLAGQKSDYFKVEMNENGVFIKPVRFSKGGKRILTGGRSGRKFSDSAKRVSQLSAKALSAAMASNPNIKRLNKRALSVGIDLALRSTAAKGGTMAVQWLDKNRKKRKSSTVKSSTAGGKNLIMRSTKGIPLGMVEFSGGGDSLTVTLSGLVPGTSKQAASHGIIAKVSAGRIADRLAYILPRLNEVKKQALLKSLQ